MTRKRCIKLLMSYGISRDRAREITTNYANRWKEVDKLNHIALWSCTFVRFERGCYEKVCDYWKEIIES